MMFRVNIIETLRKLEAMEAVNDARREIEHRKYRAEVVAELGTEWVEKTERELANERKY